VSAFNGAIAAHVEASVDFRNRAKDDHDPDRVKDWTLAAKNEAQAALALVQAKKTHEMEGRR
jgi:DNA-binding protein YbaB